MSKGWEDKGAFLLPVFVLCLLVFNVLAPAISQDAVEAWFKSPSALLTPIIAIIAVHIANQQKEIARQQAITAERKLKHDLWEKRFASYNSVINLVSSLLTRSAQLPSWAETVDTQQLSEFSHQFMVSYFLFDKDVFEYLGTFNEKVKRLWAIEQLRKHSMRPEQPSQFEDERNELILWFVDQPQLARATFSQYLALDF